MTVVPVVPWSMASTRLGFTAIFPAPLSRDSSGRLYAARLDFRKRPGRGAARAGEAPRVCKCAANRVFQSAQAARSRDQRIENPKSPADSRASALSLRGDRQEEKRP